MKCYVVYDKQGNIISASYLDQPLTEEDDYETLRSEVVPEEDQTLVELEVPNEYTELSPTDFFDRLRIDLQTKLS
jgi:hypothetical protein